MPTRIYKPDLPRPPRCMIGATYSEVTKIDAGEVTDFSEAKDRRQEQQWTPHIVQEIAAGGNKTPATEWWTSSGREGFRRRGEGSCDRIRSELRTCRICSCPHYLDGEKRYILAPKGS